MAGDHGGQRIQTAPGGPWRQQTCHRHPRASHALASQRDPWAPSPQPTGLFPFASGPATDPFPAPHVWAWCGCLAQGGLWAWCGRPARGGLWPQSECALCSVTHHMTSLPSPQGTWLPAHNCSLPEACARPRASHQESLDKHAIDLGGNWCPRSFLPVLLGIKSREPLWTVLPSPPV